MSAQNILPETEGDTMRKIILAALDAVTVDALVTKAHAEQLATELAEALDEAGYVIRKKPAPRKAAAPVAVFSPNTGNAELDGFMSRSHAARGRKTFPQPKIGPGLPPLRPMKVSEQERAERDWDAEVERAAERVASGKPSESEAVLRDLIELHYPSFVLARTEGETGYGRKRTRVFASRDHSGVEIHETTDGGRSYAVEYEIHRDGEKADHERLHG